MERWRVPGYAELRALGSGGFGDVVAARDERAGALVAIKYLRPDLLSDPVFAEMFRGEARALAGLADPDIVRLIEYVEAPGGAAIVMELVDGVSLRDVLARYGATGPEAALVVLHGSLMGLAAAHRAGVVHRDYKPENVLVDGQGASKLTDFGLAARSGDRPLPAGTLAYAAPEQVDGQPATPACDVYAATATFYECITGHPPFADDLAELAREHRAEPVSLDPVPEVLRPLVAAGMAKDPAWRPADAAILAAQLEAAAASGYGPGWQQRGRSRLREVALLLAALWPTATTPAAQGTEIDHLHLAGGHGTGAGGTGAGLGGTGTSGIGGIGAGSGTGAGSRIGEGRGRGLPRLIRQVLSSFLQLGLAKTIIVIGTVVTVGTTGIVVMIDHIDQAAKADAHPVIKTSSSPATGPCHAAAPAPPGTAYVVGSLDNDTGTVTPVNLAAGTAATPIPVGSNAGPIAITPDGKTAYVTSVFDGVTPVNLATDTAGTPIPVAGGAAGIAITPDGKTAYVTTYNGRGIIPISLPAGRPGTPIATRYSQLRAIAITPDGKTAYVGSQYGHIVIPVNLATATPGTPIPVGGSPHAIAITPDGKTAYVAGGPADVGEGGSYLTAINVTTNTPGKPIPLAGIPQAIAITPDCRTAYISSESTLTPVSLPAGTLGTPIPIGPFPLTDVAITPDGKTAYVTDPTSGTIIPVSLPAGTLGTPIKAGPGSYSVAFTP